LNLMLVNPRHLRGIRGRNSDPSNAAFLARPGAPGMVLGSFVPPRTIRKLRDVTRRRTELAADRGREIQRILGALIAGERGPRLLAELATGKGRRKTGELAAALEGEFTDHHAWMCWHFLDKIDHLAHLVEVLDARAAGIVTTLARDQDLDNLDTIPGIGRAAAEIINAETGGEIDFFAIAGHLASWIGVCPGSNESAGVNKCGHTRHGNANLKRVLGTAAMAAIKREDSYSALYYRRVAARRVPQRALFAAMHKIVIAIWHVLHDHVVYHDLGADYLTRHDPQRAVRCMTKGANSLGLTIRFDPNCA
jgi:transposase